MIEMLEGVPGSGKSYHAVADKLLPWLRAGRRLYVAIDGIYLDRLAAFENRTIEDLHKQMDLLGDERRRIGRPPHGRTGRSRLDR